MKNVVAIVISVCFARLASAQSFSLGDSLRIKFLPMDKLISDSAHLYCAVVYENITHRPVLVYKYLSFGNYLDKFCNIGVKLERESAGKYGDGQTMFYDMDAVRVFSDSLRHYDLPKSPVPASYSDTLKLNFWQLGVDFEAGNYRVKVSLRINTIPDNTEHIPDPTGATVPPEDKIEYATSDWIHFQILRKVYIAR